MKLHYCAALFGLSFVVLADCRPGLPCFEEPEIVRSIGKPVRVKKVDDGYGDRYTRYEYGLHNHENIKTNPWPSFALQFRSKRINLQWENFPAEEGHERWNADGAKMARMALDSIAGSDTGLVDQALKGVTIKGHPLSPLGRSTVSGSCLLGMCTLTVDIQ